VARAYADRALAAAEQRGVRAAVAVIDELGQLMQLDRMDGASPQAPDLAEAKAQTALNFQRPTVELQKTLSPDRLAEIKQIAHYQILVGAGGVPIVRDGYVVGAIGVHGGGADLSAELARAALEG
jgi:glc operon protein GlcG